MTFRHFTGAVMALLISLSGASPARAQEPALPPPEPGMTSYIVLLGARAIGREDVSVTRNADGWLVRGASRLGPPLDITTRRAEVRYDGDWRPKAMVIDSITRG